MTTVALADDHHLIRQALIELINQFPNYQVVFDAPNGCEFLDKLSIAKQNNCLPDIALIDINMPLMNGYETTESIFQQFPEVKVMALSVDDNEESIIKNASGRSKRYLLKDTETCDFKLALDEIKNKGYYHSDLVSSTLLNSIKPINEKKHLFQVHFQAREQEFIQLACTELTYKEIADKMCLSPRTIDGYRESLFDKLELKSRVGLAIFAIKHGFFTV